ncbi:MAG: acyl carrier protein [Elainellaceae cyanobacterium]
MKTQNLEPLQTNELLKTGDRTDSPHNPKTRADIQAWLVAYIAAALTIAPDTIDITTSFDRYGLDSLTAISLTGELEIWLGREVDPMLLYDYPTIQSLAQSLAETNHN